MIKHKHDYESWTEGGAGWPKGVGHTAPGYAVHEQVFKDIGVILSMYCFSQAASGMGLYETVIFIDGVMERRSQFVAGYDAKVVYDGYLLSIRHALGIPFKKLPLYIHDEDPLINMVCRKRLAGG